MDDLASPLDGQPAQVPVNRIAVPAKPSARKFLGTLNAKRAPMVTCILVISDPARIGLAQTTVNLWIKQTYQAKQLVIVNATGKPVTNAPYAWIKEIAVDPNQYATVGALRNKGIDEADGSWIMPWDDDDHAHNHRIAFQMAYRADEKCCVMLARQIRIDVRNNTVCVFKDDLAGLPSTVLFPHDSARYDDGLTGGEDIELISRCFRDNRVVLPNDSSWFPGPALSIASWHGKNVLSREEFLGEYAHPVYVGQRPIDLTDDHIEYIKHAMSTYGMRVDVTKIN